MMATLITSSYIVLPLASVLHSHECTALTWMYCTHMNVPHSHECTALTWITWMYRTHMNVPHSHECTALTWMYCTHMNVPHSHELMYRTHMNVPHSHECTTLTWMYRTHMNVSGAWWSFLYRASSFSRGVASDLRAALLSGLISSWFPHTNGGLRDEGNEHSRPTRYVELTHPKLVHHVALDSFATASVRIRLLWWHADVAWAIHHYTGVCLLEQGLTVVFVFHLVPQPVQQNEAWTLFLHPEEALYSNTSNLLANWYQ